MPVSPVAVATERVGQLSTMSDEETEVKCPAGVEEIEEVPVMPIDMAEISLRVPIMTVAPGEIPPWVQQHLDMILRHIEHYGTIAPQMSRAQANVAVNTAASLRRLSDVLDRLSRTSMAKANAMCCFNIKPPTDARKRSDVVKHQIHASE